MQTKKCRKCREEKSLSQFQPMNIWKYGVASTCKSCQMIKDFSSKSISPISKTNKNTIAKFSQETKDKILKRDWWCIICGSKFNLEFHHAYYWWQAKRWEDRNNVNQGVALCHAHHHSIHHWNDWEGQKLRRECVFYLTNFI